MKLLSVAASTLWVSSVLAHPTPLETRDAALDATVLQFALTLEHLENVFYKGALQKFSEKDFMDAGYSATYYNNLKYIAFDEQSHVQLLTSAITAAGYTPVAACKYSFPYTDVPSFITLSSILEGVGTSAYLGGAPLITSKAYLSVAGSILVAEALHTSYQRAAKGEVPMANPYGTPLDPTAVYTLAAMFITSCPASNAPLPFTAFPTLAYNASAYCTCEEPNCSPSQAIKKRDYSKFWSDYTPPATSTVHATATGSSEYPKPTMSASASYCAPPMAGATIKFTAAKAIPKGSYVTFISGLNVVSVQGTISGMDVTVAIPSVVMGQAYVLITNMDVEGTLVDSAVLFGPAIIEVAPPAPAIDYTQAK